MCISGISSPVILPGHAQLVALALCLIGLEPLLVLAGCPPTNEPFNKIAS